MNRMHGGALFGRFPKEIYVAFAIDRSVQARQTLKWHHGPPGPDLGQCGKICQRYAVQSLPANMGDIVMAWIARLLLLLAAPIAALFVARDAVNFPVVQMAIGILIFVGIVAVLATWPRRNTH